MNTLESARHYSLVKRFCHDCRTPLAVISAFARLAREEVGATPQTETVEFLGRIASRVQELEGLISDYEFIHRPPLAAGVAAVPLPELLDDIWPRLEATAQGANVRLFRHLAGPGAVARVHRIGIERALQAVVTAHCRAASGEPATVVIDCGGPADERETVRLAVFRFDGHLGPDEIEDHLPDVWESVPVQEDDLPFRARVAARIADTYGGSLHVIRGAIQRGFVFVLPKEKAGPGEALQRGGGGQGSSALPTVVTALKLGAMR